MLGACILSWGTPDMGQPAWIIMVVADVLASSRHQDISNHHVDSAVIMISLEINYFTINIHIDGLVQERRNSIATALELHLSYTNPSIYGKVTMQRSQIGRKVGNPLISIQCSGSFPHNDKPLGLSLPRNNLASTPWGGYAGMPTKSWPFIKCLATKQSGLW